MQQSTLILSKIAIELTGNGLFETCEQPPTIFRTATIRTHMDQDLFMSKICYPAQVTTCSRIKNQKWKNRQANRYRR